MGETADLKNDTKHRSRSSSSSNRLHDLKSSIQSTKLFIDFIISAVKMIAKLRPQIGFGVVTVVVHSKKRGLQYPKKPLPVP